MSSSRIVNKLVDPVYDGYKEPLDPVKDGFGYYGVISTNEEKTHLQCHLCGDYFEMLSQHSKKAHEMSALDYKLTFGFPPSSSLIGVDAKKNMSANAYALHKREGKEILERLNKARKLGNSWSKSLEQLNKEGKCPAQLLQRIKDLEETLGHTPSETDFLKHYKGTVSLSPIKRTFGNWGTAVELAGLTPKTISESKTRYSKQKLMVMIDDFKSKHGRLPEDKDCRVGGELPSTWTWWKHFGGLIPAREVYKIWSDYRTEKTKDELFMDDKEWEEWWNKLPENKAHKIVDWGKESKLSHKRILERRQ